MIFSAAFPTESMQTYAASRGLTYEDSGLLPPLTKVLKAGLGVGERRASVVTSETEHSYTSVGGFTKRPERVTRNLCQGTLPGAFEGAIAHHQHLELRSGGSDSGESWHLVTDTVVVTRLPERTRAVCSLNVTPGTPGTSSALFEMKVGSRAPIVVFGPLPKLVEQRGSYTFDLNPAEDVATLDAFANETTMTALAHAPVSTRVELTDGALCVSVPGILEDAGQLDTLCAVALGIIEGVRTTVARHGDLDPTEPIPVPPLNPRQEWLDEGIARVNWVLPPASVADARHAYEPIVAQRAKGSGHRARGTVLALGLVGSFLWFGICFAAMTFVKVDPLYALGVAFVTALIGVWKTIRVAFESASEVAADEIAAQAGPWGLEAFAQGYARARGLTLEDPDVFRHRASVPLGGRALRVWGGDLGEGVRGHVALWREAEAHWLVAAVPAGAEVSAAPPYVVTRSGGVLVVGRQVEEAGRSAAELDALISEARRLSARPVPAAR